MDDDDHNIYYLVIARSPGYAWEPLPMPGGPRVYTQFHDAARSAVVLAHEYRSMGRIKTEFAVHSIDLNTSTPWKVI